MRVVVDTNVLVSALLTPGRTPDLCLGALRARRAAVLVDARVEAEYREVLGRPKFRAVDGARRATLLEGLLAGCVRVGEAPRFEGALLDDDDRVFIEVALAGRADALLTGNARHYPQGVGFEVLSPAAMLARLGGLTDG